MEKKVAGNAETQEAICLICPIMPFNILYCCIRSNLNFHGHSINSIPPHQNLRSCFPFEVVERSQEDIVILIHSSAAAPLNRKNVLPVSDFDPPKIINVHETLGSVSPIRILLN